MNMNKLPRQKLRAIILQYGRSICDEPQRCEALLRDYCGQYRGEISVLVNALKEKVAANLLSSQNTVPIDILIARLTKQLQNNLYLAEGAARWAVESWAVALGVISEEETGNNSLSSVQVSYQQETIQQESNSVEGQQDNVEEATSKGTQSFSRDSNQADAYNKLGVDLQRKGDLEGAINYFTEALTINPNLAKAYYNRGNAYHQQGDIEGAIADYTQVIQLDSNNAQAYYNRGNAYHQQGDIESAISDYTDALKLDSKNAKTYKARGIARESKRNLEGAVSDLTQAARLFQQQGNQSNYKQVVKRLEKLKRQPLETTNISEDSLLATDQAQDWSGAAFILGILLGLFFGIPLGTVLESDSESSTVPSSRLSSAIKIQTLTNFMMN